MEAKKKEQLQLEKNSGVYFVFGLCVMLLLTYIALEGKTYLTPSEFENTALNDPDYLLEEQIPILVPPKPPKPKFIPPMVKEIPDESEVDETLFEVPEPNQETEILEVSDIAVVEKDLPDYIPIHVVEEVPIFPGCESASDKYDCFQIMMQNHIRKNFKYPELAIEMGQQGKVYTQFTIQKDGSISNIQLRGPNSILVKEAERILEKLPKMTPGKQGGKPVKVPFAVPIHFVLE